MCEFLCGARGYRGLGVGKSGNWKIGIRFLLLVHILINLNCVCEVT